MTGNEYQQLAYVTANKELNRFDQLRNAAYGLNGEAGEVIDILKKHEFQGHELDTAHIMEELGDVMWYVALGCTALNIDLDKIMEANIDKLRRRYPDGFSSFDSINRLE